jgi:hypothetical protein
VTKARAAESHQPEAQPVARKHASSSAPKAGTEKKRAVRDTSRAGSSDRANDEPPAIAKTARTSAPTSGDAAREARESLRRIVRAEDLPPLPPDAFEILTSYVRDE